MQNTAARADGKLFTVLGDSIEFLIADTQSGKVKQLLREY